jgi:hypothetical protein
MMLITFLATIGVAVVIAGAIVAYRNRDILFSKRQVA